MLKEALKLSLLKLQFQASFWHLKKVFWEFLADLELGHVWMREVASRQLCIVANCPFPLAIVCLGMYIFTVIIQYTIWTFGCFFTCRNLVILFWKVPSLKGSKLHTDVNCFLVWNSVQVFTGVILESSVILKVWKKSNKVVVRSVSSELKNVKSLLGYWVTHRWTQRNEVIKVDQQKIIGS